MQAFLILLLTLAAASLAATPVVAQGPAAAVAPPSFEIVTLPAGEGTVIAGTAAPGATVDILDRERTIATAIANRRGEWAVGLAGTLAPGTYRLAVRVTAPDGSHAVISDRRISLVMPDTASVALPGQIEVQEGDNLWLIARRLYGSGIYFDLLFDANRGIISSPRAIFPGQVLSVPPLPPPPR